MKKILMLTASLMLLFATSVIAANLPTGTLLTIDKGFNGANSYFTMAASSAGLTTTFMRSTTASGAQHPNSTDGGLLLGVIQPNGSCGHAGPPSNATDFNAVDKPWSFFGNTGMHFDAVGINGDPDVGTISMTGWNVAWAGICAIDMGGDLLNTADTGVGAFTVSGTNYTVDYNATVPLCDPSGFGGVPYGLHLEGRVVINDPCAGNTCDDGDPCNGIETCDGSSGSPVCVPGTPIDCTPLPAGTLLTIDKGFNGATSYFTMAASSAGLTTTGIRSTTAAGAQHINSTDGGLLLGVIQPSGSCGHAGAPTAADDNAIDKPWSFFGNTGMHFDAVGINAIPGAGTIAMTGWNVAWAGICAIDMGGDLVNTADTGVGSFNVVGTNYTVDYNATVPLCDPSGFGGVPYGLHLEGRIIDDLCAGFVSEPTTCGVGECASTGVTTCDPSDGSISDTCLPGTPSAEVCDGLDNDCNGTADDGIAPVPSTCGVGECASTGTIECIGGVLVDSCVEGTPSAEVCDNLDNDCNGLVDDGIAPIPTTCGVGECAATGEMVCIGGQMVDNCTPGDPTPEVCDDLDNDCDGLIDEDNVCGVCTDGDERPTTCGVGECAGNTGIETCVNGQWTGDTCDPLAGATPEVCDGLDNDCNGVVDDGIPTTPTTCGIGECASTGEMACVDGMMVDTCVPGDPSPEVCDDGLDNDCDGAVDIGDEDCVCNWKSEKIRGGGQRPTTTDLQIQTQFTVLNDGCITAVSASTITVENGTVLAFNCKVGDGPEPSSGTLDGVPLNTDILQVIICDETVTGDGTHKLILENKGNGGKDTDRMSIKVAK